VENYGEYGMEAEKVVIDFLRERLPLEMMHHIPGEKIAYSSPHSQEATYKQISRSKQGDISIDFDHRYYSLNVVRGTWISHQAVEDFRGQFYCLFPNGDISNPTNGRVIRSRTIQAYRNTCIHKLRKDEIINDKPGFRYKNIQASLSLEDFVVHLSKMIIAGYTQGTKEYYVALAEPFVKDDKKNKGYQA
jgi:hypothetical protein